jgi:hypothetical protein
LGAGAASDFFAPVSGLIGKRAKWDIFYGWLMFADQIPTASSQGSPRVDPSYLHDLHDCFA